jgi:molybdopterin-containing oxidoreductase family iron-sulfur binding subunit
VREGRVVKLEGNTVSHVSGGKLCQMGQAGLQNHYNPDRLTRPLIRKGQQLEQASWEEALAAIEAKTGANSGVNGSRVAWLTGTVSGHQSVLLREHLDGLQSNNHFVHELINTAISDDVNKDIYGEDRPVFHLDKAKAVLSLGADFLGASVSPVMFAREYAGFRSATPRGVLIQVEPSMSLTGANADMWQPARPGSEGALVLGIANLLITKYGVDAAAISDELRTTINGYTLDRVVAETGIEKERVEKITNMLRERSPSLVLVGPSATGHAHGYQTAAAAQALNLLLGNVGKTITSAGAFPFPLLAARTGSMRDLLAFVASAEKGALDVAFIYKTNPAYTSPAYVKFEEKFSRVPFKVVLSQFLDETAKGADVVLPLASALEDWGTHVAAYNPQQISLQQPLMEKLHAETRGAGDVLLALVKMRSSSAFNGFADYYAYLREALNKLPEQYKGAVAADAFWNETVGKGVLNVPVAARELQAKTVNVALPTGKSDAAFPLQLVPAARLGLWDGRHANLPWIQESPDQITKAVWGSWAEIHPTTAESLDVKTGDFVTVTSPQGSVTVPVYIYRGVHPEAVAIPLGQGHESYGQWATGRGVNPVKLFGNGNDSKTGELALYATRVKLTKAAHKESEKLVQFGGSETQIGRKLVATVKADVFNRTEGA